MNGNTISHDFLVIIVLESPEKVVKFAYAI